MPEPKTGTHPDHGAGARPCRVCSSPVDEEHHAAVAGICPHCAYKLLVILFVIMIAASYMVWFGLF